MKNSRGHIWTRVVWFSLLGMGAILVYNLGYSRHETRVPIKLKSVNHVDTVTMILPLRADGVDKSIPGK